MALRGLVATAAQTTHQHRVVGEGLRGVDETTEQLVVPRGRQVELGADRLLFRTRVALPLTLEGEEREITVG